MMDAPVCLVRGPKKTGKSTFARTLLNRLLSRFASDMPNSGHEVHELSDIVMLHFSNVIWVSPSSLLQEWSL
jgi:predicted AAA+ superfamily ATPase